MASSQIIQLNSPELPKKKILCLGYDRTQTKIIDALIAYGCEVHHTVQKIYDINYDLIVSFGYRHILKAGLLAKIDCPIFNLHISYLPYNKGAHPNFWSFYDNTPSGVTIHLIDEGLDTGLIVYQKTVNFEQGEKTFKQTYIRLIKEIESLFLENLADIVNEQWTAKPQSGQGTQHSVKDLPCEFSGWDVEIESEIKRLYCLRTGANNDTG